MDKTNYERVVKGFYDYLEKGKVMGRKCPRCGAVEFPAYIACNSCGNPKTEWQEITGKAVITGLKMPTIMHSHPNLAEEFGGYCYVSVKLEEGSEINSMLVGVKPEMRDEMRARLPIPVKPKIVQQDGYKTVFWELDE